MRPTRVVDLGCGWFFLLCLSGSSAKSVTDKRVKSAYAEVGLHVAYFFIIALTSGAIPSPASSSASSGAKSESSSSSFDDDSGWLVFCYDSGPKAKELRNANLFLSYMLCASFGFLLLLPKRGQSFFKSDFSSL